ncbi:MAG: hypothetical protein ACRD2C_08240 [Acidimicrobiales bacterium]
MDCGTVFDPVRGTDRHQCINTLRWRYTWTGAAAAGGALVLIHGLSSPSRRPGGA